MTLTGNAKNGTGFYVAAILTGILAFLVLFYKGTSDEHAARMAAVANLPTRTQTGLPTARKPPRQDGGQRRKGS